MELGVFVVAIVLIAGIGLLAFGRMPFPIRRADSTVQSGPPGPADQPAPRTAEPAGHVDDSG